MLPALLMHCQPRPGIQKRRRTCVQHDGTSIANACKANACKVVDIDATLQCTATSTPLMTHTCPMNATREGPDLPLPGRLETFVFTEKQAIPLPRSCQTQSPPKHPNQPLSKVSVHVAEDGCKTVRSDRCKSLLPILGLQAHRASWCV